MEHRSALTLKAGDVIEIPGLGAKQVGAISQTSHDRYRIRLDEKFVPSVDIDVLVTNGEHRSPERNDGPWNVDRRSLPSQTTAGKARVRTSLRRHNKSVRTPIPAR